MILKILIPGMMPSFRQTLARKSYSLSLLSALPTQVLMSVCMPVPCTVPNLSDVARSFHKGEMPFLLEKVGWDLNLMLLLYLYLYSGSSYPRNTRLEDSSPSSITF